MAYAPMRRSSGTVVERSVHTMYSGNDSDGTDGSDDSIGLWKATAIEEKPLESDLLRLIRSRGRKLKVKFFGASMTTKAARNNNKINSLSSDEEHGAFCDKILVSELTPYRHTVLCTDLF